MVLQVFDNGVYQFPIQITSTFARLLNNLDNYLATRRLADAVLSFTFAICATKDGTKDTIFWHFWDKAKAKFEHAKNEQQMTSMIVAGMQARGIDTDALGISVMHDTVWATMPDDHELHGYIDKCFESTVDQPR
eukprot:TRINITY_DN21086_c0_g2_i1.p1 TRINITY_DN21086_c0_g2~~TRINITY_DN21086_c0_g2_i1.p1  ORF type:complete len:134 (+),score=19.30 TRINITY_DN21086_c0_g2_i1:115-516(+)